MGLVITDEQQREMQQQASEQILAQAAAILAESGVPHESEILIGPAGRRIAERADELGCDGIVMGTHGRTAIVNLLMGSVATRVVHFVKVPVTLVK